MRAIWLDISHYCNYCLGDVCLTRPAKCKKAYDDYVHVVQLLVLDHHHVIDSVGLNQKCVKNIVLDDSHPDFDMHFEKGTLVVFLDKKLRAKLDSN